MEGIGHSKPKPIHTAPADGAPDAPDAAGAQTDAQTHPQAHAATSPGSALLSPSRSQRRLRNSPSVSFREETTVISPATPSALGRHASSNDAGNDAGSSDGMPSPAGPSAVYSGDFSNSAYAYAAYAAYGPPASVVSAASGPSAAPAVGRSSLDAPGPSALPAPAAQQSLSLNINTNRFSALPSSTPSATSPLGSPKGGSRLGRSKTMPTKRSVVNGDDDDISEVTSSAFGTTLNGAQASGVGAAAAAKATGAAANGPGGASNPRGAQGLSAAALRRTQTLPSRRVQLLQEDAGINTETDPAGSLMRTLSFRRKQERPLQPYGIVPYPSKEEAAAPYPATLRRINSDARSMHITAVNYVSTPKDSALPTSPAATPLYKTLQRMPSLAFRTQNANASVSSLQKQQQQMQQQQHYAASSGYGGEGGSDAGFSAGSERVEKYRRDVHDSFKFRAFTRKAISFQRRQWFTNICCISLCPFLMIMVSFLLKSVISNLTNSNANAYQILYCSNELSINEQNWPIYNLSGAGITVTPASEVPNAIPNLPVRHANFFTRASLVDLSARDVFSQLSSTTLTGSLPCVNWFGLAYPYDNNDMYERAPSRQVKDYANKDSLYTSQVNSGWLDILAPLLNGDLTSPISRQAISLARAFAVYQTRPWAVVAMEPGVDRNVIGTAPREQLLQSGDQIPKYNFKPANSSNGMLDTIESRYAVQIEVIPYSFKGYQKVPYFNISSSSRQSDLDAMFQSTIQQAINNLARVDAFALQGSPTDAQVATLLSRIGEAASVVPYAAVLFKRVDHPNKNYSYVMQVGNDERLDKTPGFPTSGFRMLLQQAQLSNAIARFSSPALQGVSITQGIRSFPVLGQTTFDIPFGSIIGRILYPLGISFLLPIFTISLVRDKEMRVVTMLRMNGLGSPSAYYIAEYVTFLLNYIVSTAIFWIAGYLTRLELFTKTDPLVLLILFILWGNIQVTLAMFFNSIYRRSRIALIGVFLIVVCGVVTSFILDEVFPEKGEFPIVLCVWPPLAFYRALGVLNRAATSSLQVPYILSMVAPGDELFSIIIALAVEIVVFILLSIYLGNVVPSEFGTNLPWHYPFTSLATKFGLKKNTISQSPMQPREGGEIDVPGEDDDVRAERVRVLRGNYDPSAPLVMRDMAKQYTTEAGTKKQAVTNITLAVDTGTVFGLLGPNGAGKTSLISILTGVYEPTAGDATLAGYDIIAESDAAFRSIGVCPQFDILWPDLTVDEHLFFYARLKGVSREYEREAVVASAELVKLETLRGRRIKNLSGGEKRRLSIAIALVADPRVVFLDEPTTGLDPEVRRSVWDVIARARSNRAILMTTHSMEEAEVCCQRIGIMAKGTMRCVGTAARLKDLYGAGYKLYIYGESKALDAAEQYILAKVLPRGGRSNRIQVFNNVRLYTFRPEGDELAVIFETLTNEHRRYGIQSWGISQTTLDEIFTSLITEEDAS
ncbi:hypothetical protein BC831DRAFT_548420 [Entophlyctis helioformis]|nr:hypothetical protein BC831DRAFT_548420 [Entophlyctis helioformis]